ncbi:MAG: Ppx/GppA phosphatase family protein [Pseudomonadota bacterium]
MAQAARPAREPHARSRAKRSRSPAQGQRAMFAALDLGTNSCRMLIAHPQGAHFKIVDAFAKTVRLGPDIERDGALSASAIDRTISALKICASKIKKHDVAHRRLVATEACRRARNGDAFLEMVKDRTGLSLEVIAPDEEARLAVVSCAPLVTRKAQQVMVFDIGGGSTELVWIDVSHLPRAERKRAVMRLGVAGPEGIKDTGARVVDFISVPLGVATLNEKFSDVVDEPARFALMSWFFEEQLQAFSPYQNTDILGADAKFQMIGTSGTVTTVAAAHLGLKRYDRRKVDGMTMTAGEIEAVVNRLVALSPQERMRDPNIGRDRAKLILAGAAILQTLLRLWPTERLRVADRGLREGMLYSMMSAERVLTEDLGDD